MPETLSFDNSSSNPLGNAVELTVKYLIEACDKTNIEYPDLKCDIDIDDGRKYKLTFERIDF